MSLDLNSTNVEYKDNKVIIKSIPKNGENLSVFMRPGDEVVFDIEGLNSDELEYILVGGDIVVSFAGEGVLTFPSLGLMGFSSNPPQFSFGGKAMSVDSILSRIEEVNELPITSVDASFKVTTSNNEENEAPTGTKVVVVSQNESSSGTGSKTQDFTQEQPMASVSSQSTSISTSTPMSDPFTETMPKNDFDGYKQDTDLVPPPDVDLVPDGGSSSPDDTPGTGDYDQEATTPAFGFKATAHQVTYTETTNSENEPLILGGGGSIEGYKNDSQTDQFSTELIDMSHRSEDMTIRSENSAYFDNDPTGTNYLSRVLRFEPNMPQDYLVGSFTISGLPANVKILDKNANEITGSSISKEDMIFKDELGNIIEIGSPNFATSFKSVEFTIKYDDSITDPFDISIRANYELDPTSTKVDLASSVQSDAQEYTVALKDITKADDYVYKKEDFTDGKDDGFILSKDANTNTIKDGSGNSTIIGGFGTDIVYDGAGDDTIYLSGGSDIVYGGAGHNTIYGDTYLKNDGTTEVDYAEGRDKVSYAEVKSYTLAELKYLKDNGYIDNQEYQKLSGTYQAVDDDNPIPNSVDIEMQKYYKGVYVDLKGFTDEETIWIDSNGDGIVDEDEKINALSKFALKEEFSFTYDEDGNVTGVTSTTLPEAGLQNIQLIGQDKFKNIDDIDGSAYNDTIYGNDEKNIINGMAGSDIIDGRAGENELYGGAGNDVIFSGSGNDYIDGGEDTDAVNYQNSTNVNGVEVRLDKPNGDEYDDYATGYGNDTLVSIEDVIGSNYDDVIYGSSGTNYLQGMGGDDKFISGRGYDFIDGGEGSDWISYYRADYPNNATNPDYMEDIQGIRVTIGNDFVMVKETTTDRLIDLIKDIEQVRGTKGNDYIWGDNSDETFWGLEGDDDLRGWNGNDTLYGGGGDDFLLPGRGVDFSDGGDGVDFLHLYYDALKNKNSQWLRLSEDETIAGGQSVGLGTVIYSTDNGTSWNYGYDTSDGINTAINIEGLHGSSGSDYLIGNSQANRFIAHNGDDEIYGMGGDDFIRGGNGDDLIYGGDGDDTIYGDGDNDIIYGGDGDDTVYGYSVYDWKYTNQDIMDGGSGANTLNYSLASHGGFELDMRTLALDAAGTTTNGVNTEGYASVIFNASDGSNNKTNVANAYNDKVKNFQTIIGSRDGDTIYANDSGMTLDGWSGLDYLYGGTGDDTIIARNQNGEILKGGSGTDTLELAQNVDFRTNTRNITIEEFEVLELSSYNAYLTLAQWDLNAFEKVVGEDNSRIYMYSTNSVTDDNFNFTNIDFSDFSGSMYIYGYNGNDIYDFSGSTLSADMNFYLDASSGFDTLKMGTSQNISMLDNYYNTFEKFEVGVGSTLEINAHNDGGRRFYADTKDFDDVSGDLNFIGGSGNDRFDAGLDKFSAMSGKVSIEGGAGDDTFYANYEALLAGKLTIDGESGSDTVDIRTTKEGETLTLNDLNMFNNIERLELDQVRLNSVEMDAKAIQDWISADGSFVLDIYNDAQGDNVVITNTKSDNMTGFEIGQSYDIVLQDDTSFTMQVV